MTIGMAVRERILQLCRERGITVNKLAVLSGVTQSTLNNIVGGRNHSTTVSTLQKVCDGLNITITEFFASDIFADAVIRLTYQDESVEFSPFLSLKDGSVDIGARGLDLTKPAE